MKLFDTVETTVDLPAHAIKTGMVGAIIEVFDAPHQAYEVEFVDAAGRTIAQAAMLPHQIRVVHGAEGDKRAAQDHSKSQNPTLTAIGTKKAHFCLQLR